MLAKNVNVLGEIFNRPLSVGSQTMIDSKFELHSLPRSSVKVNRANRKRVSGTEPMEWGARTKWVAICGKYVNSLMERLALCK